MEEALEKQKIPQRCCGEKQIFPDDNITQADSRKSCARVTIGVIGTGNAAIAITKRLLSIGYSVIVGSRKPSLRHVTLTQLGHCLCGAELTSIAECISRCEIIVVAIHMENFRVTLEPYSRLTRGKIVIDLSNRETRYVSRSNAEYLASILPEAEVVKAFNTISASVMENKLNLSVESQKVFVACDNEKVRNTILDLSRSMGFHAVDFGGLKNSLHVEDFVLKVFSHWKIPIFLTIGIFNLWSLYIVYIYFIDTTAYKWEQLFLKVLNKPVCMTAVTTLALTYLPGQLASIIQVCRGTKHSRFPRVLDTWLKSRKQFGLITFGLVCFHVIASTLMLSPTYYSSWFHQPTVILPHPENSKNLTSDPVILPISTSWMVWKGELALLFGIISFLAMSIQAVTSIPSLATSLNWSEWRCVQSKMGTCVLFFGVCHVFCMGIPGWLKIGPAKTMGSITFLSLLLPLVVLFVKIVFGCTPLNCYLRKIRKGWERPNRDGDDEQNLKLDKLNAHKRNYTPLSNTVKNGSPCCGIEDDCVTVTMGRNDGSGHFDKHLPCCCRGNDMLDNVDSGSVDRTKSTVRFASNTKCDCSVV